ncbi:MAG TPA: GTPase [Thermoplasmatales archaeon]|nr:MAG: GTPase [Thermoplasmata archaeon]HDM24981.1 GTPase [Thermoplasmatales archaeon]
MSKENIFVYLVGTAGSGKSTLAATFQEWFNRRGLDCIIVNLDPGAESLPYSADVDVRDWISLKEIMKEYGLGPNGAQIACADMLALNTGDIKTSIEGFKTDYVLLDTPGQLELFVFREAGKYMVDHLNRKRSVLVYLLDPLLAKEPSGFISQLLLSVSTHFRLGVPQINVLSKADLLTREQVERIEKWSEDSSMLYEDVQREEASVYRELSENLFKLLNEFGGYTHFITTSSETLLGMEDLYTIIQMEFEGGEDLLSD